MPETPSYRNYVNRDVIRTISLLSGISRPQMGGVPTVQQSHENDSVGNPNLNNEGGTMPETGNDVVSIPVLPTYEDQRTIFDRLGIAEGLMQSLDLDNWSRHLDALRNGYTPATFNVRVGSYRVEGHPTATVGDDSIRLASVTVETAKEIFAAASANRITLNRVSEGEYQLKTLSLIEDQAFVAMYGNSTIRSDVDPSGTETMVVAHLRTLMNRYREFRDSPRRDAIRQALRTNMQNSLNPYPEKKATTWDSEKAKKFADYFANIQKGLVVTENPFDDMEILPHGTLSSRFWGIEIEAVDVSGVRTPKYWEQKTDGSLRGLQHESLPSNSGNPPGADPEAAPRTDHDADCQSRTLEEGCECGECYYDCSCGYDQERVQQEGRSTVTCEWNSPVLRSFHSKGLEYICSQIEYRRTNSTPGIHVHVEAADLTPDQVVTVSLLYSALEPLFEAEYKRQTRTYCKTMGTDVLIGRLKAAGDVKGQAVNVRHVFSDDRYLTVNTQSLSSHGTIEFRAMGARYNYEFLIRWAHFLREIINMAKANVPQKAWRNVKTFRDLIVLMSKYGKETPTPSWIDSESSAAPIVERLGTENRRLANAADIRNVRTVFDSFTGEVELLTGSRF